MKKNKIFRHEAALLLKLTGPILLAQLSQTSMSFVDTVMAGRVGPVDLAAVAVGSSFFFPIFLFLVGLLSAVTPLAAQAHGSRDSANIFRSLQQGIVVGFFCGIVTMVFIWQLSPLFQLLHVSPEITSPAKRYLFAVSLGMPFGGIFLALRSGGEGVSLTRLSMISGFVGLAVNIVANYVLIFGKLGLPAMGGVGCGWATAISMFAMMITMAFLLQKSRVEGVTNLFYWLDRTLWQSMGQFLALCFACVTCIFIITCADTIALLYTKEIAVRQTAVHLLLFAALFQLSDSIQVNCCGALRGCKDTKIPMLLMIFAYWGIGLPVGYGLGILGFGSFEPGAEGFWIGLIIGLTFSALFQGIRLYKMVNRFQHNQPLPG